MSFFRNKSISNSLFFKSFSLIILLGATSISLVYAIGRLTSIQSDFDEGTYSNTVWNTDHVELNAGQTTGDYTSKIFDAGGIAQWNNISRTQG